MYTKKKVGDPNTDTNWTAVSVLRVSDKVVDWHATSRSILETGAVLLNIIRLKADLRKCQLLAFTCFLIIKK